MNREEGDCFLQSWSETKIWKPHCHELLTSGSEPHIQKSTSGSWSPAPSASCMQRRRHNGTAGKKMQGWVTSTQSKYKEH